MRNRRGYTKLEQFPSEDQLQQFASLSFEKQKTFFNALSAKKQKIFLDGLNNAPGRKPTLRFFLQNLLKEMIGGEAKGIELDKLTADQLKQVLRSLAKQLAPFYVDPEAAQGMIGDAIDKTDVGYHTFLRLWQVFGYVAANGTNSDANNDDTSFNQVMSDPAAAWSFGAISVLPAVIGAYLRYKQLKTKRERNTIAYQQKQIKKSDPKHREITEKEILEGYNDLLSREKVVPRHSIKDPKADLTKKVIGQNKFANFIRYVNGEPEFEEKIKNEGRIKKGARKVFGWVVKGWNFLASAALIFWPAWMIAVLIVGIAASYAFPALPAIILVTFAVTIAIKAGMAWYKRRAKQKAAVLEQEQTDEEKEAETNEINERSRMRSELTQRLHMKKEHGFFKEIFGKYLTPKTKPKAKKEKQKSEYVALAADKLNKKHNERIILLYKQPTVPAPQMTELEEETLGELTSTSDDSIEEHEQNVKKVLNSEIGKHLIGSKAERRGRMATTMVNTLIGQYTLSAFVLWLVGSALLAFAPISAALAAIGGLVLGAVLPGISAAFSGLVGAIYSTKAYADTKAKELAFENAIYARLSEQYKPTDPRTKAEVFDEFAFAVETKKTRLKQDLKDRQKAIKGKIALKQKITPEEQYILNFDLKKINVYNDRYFRTQEEKPSAWTIVKKGAFRLYKAVNAGQTWIFVTRSLFLMGAALAGICLLFGPAAGIAFVAIAATLAITGIVFKLTQMYLDKKAQNKKFFVDTFDARISYLKKKGKELDALDNYLQNKIPVAAHNDDLDSDKEQANSSELELKKQPTSENSPTDKQDDERKEKDLIELDLISSNSEQEQSEELITSVPETLLPKYVANGSTLFQQETNSVSLPVKQPINAEQADKTMQIVKPCALFYKNNSPMENLVQEPTHTASPAA